MLDKQFNYEKWFDNQAVKRLKEIGLPSTPWHLKRFWKAYDLATRQELQFIQCEPDIFKAYVPSHSQEGVRYLCHYDYKDKAGECACKDYKTAREQSEHYNDQGNFHCKHLINITLQLKEILS